jgi:hypothetical protein
MGKPKPEPGPVSAKLTPMLMSAKAAVLTKETMAEAKRVVLNFMGLSPVEKTDAQCAGND